MRAGAKKSFLFFNDSQEKSESIDVHKTEGPNQIQSQIHFPEIDTRRLLQSSQHDSVEMPKSVRSDHVSLASLQRSLDLNKVEKELGKIEQK